MRKKVFVCLVFLVVFICGSFVLPGPFLHSASAEAMLQPESVGGLPPLLSVSKLQSTDVTNRDFAHEYRPCATQSGPA